MLAMSRWRGILRWTTHHRTREYPAMSYHRAAGGQVGRLDPLTCTHEQWQAYRATIDPRQLSPEEMETWSAELEAYTTRCQRESSEMDQRLTAAYDHRDATYQRCEDLSQQYDQVQEQIADAQSTVNRLEVALFSADGPEADMVGQHLHQARQYLDQLYDYASGVRQQENAALEQYEQARRQARCAS